MRNFESPLAGWSSPFLRRRGAGGGGGGGDVTAPEIVDLVVGAPTGTDYPASFTISEAATVNWVLTLVATQPTPAQVAAGQTNLGVAAPSSGSFAVSGSGTYNVTIADGLDNNYYLHVSPIDASGNRSLNVDTFGPFAVDTLAPVISSPTHAASGSQSSTISVSTNEGDGTWFWVHTLTSNQPSAAQIIAGQNHLGAAAAASGSGTVTATGVQNGGAVATLTASTTYFTHFVHRDAALNISNVVSAAGSFTTAASGFVYAQRADTTAARITGPVPPAGVVSYTVRARIRLPAFDTQSLTALYNVVTSDFRLALDVRSGVSRVIGTFNDGAGANGQSVASANGSLLTATAYDIVFSATQNGDTGGFRGARLYIDGSLISTYTGTVDGGTFRQVSQNVLSTDEYAIDLYGMEVWRGLWMPTYSAGSLVSPTIPLVGGAAFWNDPSSISGWAKVGAGSFT
jgi:hypothetical protein